MKGYGIRCLAATSNVKGHCLAHTVWATLYRLASSGGLGNSVGRFGLLLLGDDKLNFMLYQVYKVPQV